MHIKADPQMTRPPAEAQGLEAQALLGFGLQVAPLPGGPWIWMSDLNSVRPASHSSHR